jgi:hypothetical protein
MMRRLIWIWIIVGIGCFSSVRSQSYQLLVGIDQVEIPFEYQHNFIVVNIRFGGKLPLRFLFDTGAEHTLLFKKSYADLLGVQYERKLTLIGSDMSSEISAFVARNVPIQLYPLAPVNQDILVLEDNFNSMDKMTGSDIDGILGASYFRNFTVQIDYSKGIITLTNPREFDPPGKKFEVYPIEIINSKPYVSATAIFQSKDTAKTRLLMDTGAGLSLLLHSNTHESIQLPSSTITGTLGSGIGGELVGYVGKINALETFNIKFNDVITSFQDLDQNLIRPDKLVRNGIIGNQILNRFVIIIDYPRSMLYLKARKNVNDKFEYDRSGLTIFAVGRYLDEYVVHEVLPGSPAWEAGIRKGDYITHLQRFPTHFYSLGSILGKLKKKEGKKIRMSIDRDGKKKIAKFELSNLF